MKFTIEINCDNAAFEEHLNGEIVRILRSVVRRLELDGLSFEKETSDMTLWDVNGNKVGKATCHE